MKILGIDASLSNFGFALTDVNMDTLKFEVEELLLIETKPGHQKKVRKNSDDLERCRKHVDAMRFMTSKAQMVCVEMPVGSQSARAMASYGACMGILAGCDLPMIQVTPYEVKLAAVGIKTASKEEMIAWAYNAYPGLNWLPGVKSGKNASKHPGFIAGKNEHLADAIAAVEAGLKTDDFKSAMAILRYAA